MSCFPKFSKVFSIFSASKKDAHSQTDADGSTENNFTPEVFEAAILRKFNRVKPRSPQVAALLPRVKTALKHRLQPQGDQIAVDAEFAQRLPARRTGFNRIFKHCKGKKFTVTLPGGQNLKRTRSEVETHALLQSFLKTEYGDPAIRKEEVLQAKATPAFQQPPIASSQWPRCRVSHQTAHSTLFAPASLEFQVPLVSPDDLESVSDSDEVNSRLSRTVSESDALATHTPDTSPIQEEAAAAVPIVPQAPANLAPVTPTVTAPQAVPLTNAQTHILEFIEDRLQLSPLEFLDQVSRENPLVAGFFAVQSAKLLTAIGNPIASENTLTLSDHPDFLVKGQIHNVGNRPEIRFKDADKQAAALRKVPATNVLMVAVAEQLKLEMARQNRMASRQTTDSGAQHNAVLPMGIGNTANVNVSPANRSANSSNASTEQRTSEVLTLFTHNSGLRNAKPVERLMAIAAANPAAAALYGVLDEMLLIKGGGTTEASTKRFPYIGDYCNLQDVPILMSDEGTVKYQTFLPGIGTTSAVSKSACALRLIEGDQCTPAQSKEHVIAHVASTALRHMTSNAVKGQEHSYYPLITYELLSHATGLPVPQHLKDAEDNVYAMVAQNTVHIEERRERAQVLQKQKAERKENDAQIEGLQMISEKVTNREQLRLSRTSNFQCNREKVTKESLDRTFPFAPDGNTLTTIRGIQNHQLAMTHVKQAVSAREGHGGTLDNRCWLRGSWISMLGATTPDIVAERYRDICDKPVNRNIIETEANLLHEIAARFSTNPIAFLHADANSKTWANHVGKAACLEYNQPPTSTNRVRGSNLVCAGETEETLKNYQLMLASCFRFENPSIMREVQAVEFPGSQASSDMPIALHRAFKVPALIIEAGQPCTDENGEHDVMGAQIRVAAPVGSELAKFIEDAAIDNLPIDERSVFLTQLLARFNDLPVLWLEQGHYDVYIPQAMLQR